MNYVGTESLLTIAIPTYNRREDVLELIQKIMQAEPIEGVQYLVVDDGSDLELLLPPDLKKFSQISIHRNDNNMGYARTFLRLLEMSRSVFVMLTADDDVIDFESLPSFVNWLRKSEADFICTQWRRVDGSLYRGRETGSQIQAKDVFAASRHAPGLCYRRSSITDLLQPLKAAVDSRSDAALVYPQVLLAAQLVARRRGVWWAGNVISEGKSRVSGIRDTRGFRYDSPESRIRQAAWFDVHFTDLARSTPLGRERLAYRRMQTVNRTVLYPACRSFVRGITAPMSLDRSVMRYALRRPVRGALKRLVPFERRRGG